MLVKDGAADLWLEADMDEPRLWQRKIALTDFPDGNWTFYCGVDGLIASVPVIVCYLPQEH